MPDSITITDPATVEMIRRVAALKTGGDAEEAVTLVMKEVLGTADTQLPHHADRRRGTLFGCMKGSIVIMPGVDLTEPLYTEAELAEIEESMMRPFLEGPETEPGNG